MFRNELVTMRRKLKRQTPQQELRRRNRLRSREPRNGSVQSENGSVQSENGSVQSEGRKQQRIETNQRRGSLRLKSKPEKAKKSRRKGGCRVKCLWPLKEARTLSLLQ